MVDPYKYLNILQYLEFPKFRLRKNDSCIFYPIPNGLSAVAFICSESHIFEAEKKDMNLKEILLFKIHTTWILNNTTLC